MKGHAVVACALAALLAGCATRQSSAPVVDRSPVAAPAPKPPVAQAAPAPGTPASPAAVSASSSGYYQVKRGDTLYSIALDHGADHRDLTQWNRLENPNRIQVGQVLRVTPPEAEQGVQVGAARGSGAVQSRPLESRPPESRPAAAAAAAAASASGIRNEPKALRLPYSSENVALLQKNDPGAAPSPQAAKPEPAPAPQASVPPPPAKPAAEPAPKPAAEPKDPEAIEFIWPARGKLLAGFAEPASKGLDIGGKPGDPVVAAAAGRVIYVGTGIRGYGKLIVIKHDNNFNSVYAHNREILVKQDQNVARGQKIAELGDTDSDAPKLHFEIRKSGKPVDPARYLPPS
jgi:lipoprotein NlpD